LKVNIRNIAGNWDKGVALDKHTVRSIPKGSNESGHMQFDTIRSEVGEALYQLKYRGDWDQVEPLAQELATRLPSLFPNIGLIVPVPATNYRPKQPVLEIATALAKKLGVPSFDNIVQKEPAADSAPQLKNLTTKAEKEAALTDRFSINDEITSRGRWNVLVLDDLFDTGASLEAVCAVLRGYRKIRKIYVATLTWK